jgi:purine-binding chemotaxis protein CheW
MHQAYQLVVFTLDEQCYAVPLSAVERIVRRVEITLVPKAPEIVLGMINVEGSVILVVDIRRRFRLPARVPHLSDHLLIARTTKRSMALVVDAVTEVVTLSGQEIVPGETILARLDYLTGVAKSPDGLILIHDLDSFLSLDEEQALRDAIESITP